MCMSKKPSGFQELLTPAEVATLLRVDPKTVTRWANDGKLTSLRTPGGHRRYLLDEVRQYLSAIEPDQPDPEPGHLTKATAA